MREEQDLDALREELKAHLREHRITKKAFAKFAGVSPALLTRFIPDKDSKTPEPLSKDSYLRLRKALDRPAPPRPFAGRSTEARLAAEDLAFAVFDSDKLADIDPSSVTPVGDRFLYNNLAAAMSKARGSAKRKRSRKR